MIFTLRSFSRNLRTEISKSVKIYFWDLGIRNSLIQNYNLPSLRGDIGALWENFCLVERLKYHQNNQKKANYYFWRTYDQKEIDLVEEKNGRFNLFEFKWQEKKIKKPKLFLSTYPQSQFLGVSRNNYWELLKDIQEK